VGTYISAAGVFG